MNINLNFLFHVLLTIVINIEFSFQQKTITFLLETSSSSDHMFPYIPIHISSSDNNKLFLLSTSFSQSLLFDNTKKQSPISLVNEEPATAVYYKSSIIGYYSKSQISLNCEINQKNSTLTIDDYDFLKVDINANSAVMMYQPENFGGVFALPRRSNYYHDSIFKKFYHKQYINENIFGLFGDKKLIVGTYENIINEGKINSDLIRNCYLYILDNKLYSQWVCKANYLIITNDTSTIGNKTTNDYLKVNLNVVFEPMIYPIILPLILKDQIINNLISNKEKCELYKQNNNDFMFRTNHINSSDLELYSIKCLKNDTIQSISQLVNEIQMKTFSIVLNGFVYTLSDTSLFSEDESAFYLNIMFANKKDNNYMVLGNVFLNQLDGIIYNDPEAKIYFIVKETNIPIHIQSVTKDKREKRGVLFFLFTIIGVAFVILLALLIPYFFYWRSKRKMLDRLNYEIIYRRVDDVQKEMLNTAE